MRWWWVLLVAALTAWAAWLRVPGLDPRSLWHDDQWVGIVVSRMTLSEYRALGPPVPAGFAASLAVLARLFPDPEWPLQVVPVACSLVQIPLIGWIVLRLTGHPALGLLAAALLLVDPLLSEYSVRAKQYSMEGLLTLGLVLLATWVVESPDRRRKSTLALASAAAMTSSFSALFVGGALVGAFLLHDVGRWRRTRVLPSGTRAAPAAFALGAALVYAIFLHGAVRPSLVDFWTSHYVPVGDPGALARLLEERGAAFFTGSFPRALAPAALLVPLGLGVALWRPATRWLGVTNLFLWTQLVAASALHRYPLGGGRTDLFAHGLTIILVCFAVSLLLSLPRMRRPLSVAVTAAALAVAASMAEPSRYPEQQDAQLVRRAHELLRPQDGLLVYPFSGLAVGYYWPGEIRLRRDDRGCGFNAEVVHPGALTLHSRPRRFGPTDFTDQLRTFLASPRARIVYLGADVDADERAIVPFVVGTGYEVAEVVRAPGAVLTVLRR